MTDQTDVRRDLYLAIQWYDYQCDDLAYSLKSAEDALKLWRYAKAHPELAEYCDEQAAGDLTDWTEAHFIAAIGYSPFKREG